MIGVEQLTEPRVASSLDGTLNHGGNLGGDGHGVMEKMVPAV